MADAVTKQRELAAIMFLDMVGYSAVSHRDEDLAQALLAELKGMVRGQVARHEGREVRTMGDGFLIEFASATAAVNMAQEIQKEIYTHNRAQPTERQFQVRLGIHFGEVVREGSDILGDDVNIAARVETLAAPGGICFTQPVLQQLPKLANDHFVDMGPTRLRNIQTPVPLYQFRPPGTPPDWRPPARLAARRLSLGVALAAVLVAAVFFAFFHKPPVTPLVAQVAILPFRAVSSGETDEALGDGFGETLAARLTQMQTHGPQLRIVPISEVRRSHVASASDARSAFGATHALIGSIERNGQMVRVNLALVDAVTQTQLRTCTTNGGIADLFDLQDILATEAAGWLGVAPGPTLAGTTAHGAQSAAAYEQYLLGVGKLARYDIAGYVDAAVRHFENALRLDTDFAAAQAGLAEALWHKHRFDPAAEWAPTARLMARRALSLNTNLARAYVVLGLVAARQGASPAEEIALYQQALAVDPFDADAWSFLAMACERGDRRDEMKAALRGAVERKPQHWAIYNRLGRASLSAGNLPEAEAFFRQAIALEPDNYVAQHNLGVTCLSMGHFAEAEKVLLRALALRGEPEVFSNLGNTYFYQHRYREALEYYQKATQQPPVEYDYWGNLGDACSRLPDKADTGKAAFEQAIALAKGELRDRPKDAVTRSYLAWYLTSLHQQTEALAQLQQSLGDAPVRGEVNFNAALIYEVCGQRSNALLHLEAARTNGFPEVFIKCHPTLAPLLEAAHNRPR